MQRILSAINEVKGINAYYQIPDEKIDNLQKSISEAKVCIPIIGKFSSGKSALVNNLLGYSKEILKTNITPETAIPAELNYTDENEIVIIEKNDGTTESISVSDYKKYEADATTVKCAKLYLDNSFLKTVPSVMIVDMPGFDSGFEIHNKAIDNYLPNSMAYIITVPADDMIIRTGIGSILRELCLHDMPICVAVTKYDKKNDGYDELFDKLKEDLKRFVGDREITYCITSSFSGDAGELEEYLKEIQEKSQEILFKSFVNTVIVIIEKTENYLKTMLKNSQLSESELGVKEEEMKRKFDNIKTKFTDEKSNFDLEIKDCVEEIKNDVQCALEAAESQMVAMAMQNKDIKEYVNDVIRTALAKSVQNRFNDRVEKYIKRVAECINGDELADGINISVDVSMEKLNKTVISSITALVAGALLSIPFLGFIAAVALAIQGNKKKEEQRQKITNELRNDVFPRIITEVGNKVKQEVARITLAINSSIENDFKNHKETLEKAMEDLKNQKNDENKRKQDLEGDIEADLERLDMIKQSLA